MANWVPMFALPNVRMNHPVEIDYLAIVHASEPRAQALASTSANFKHYMTHFKNEFDVDCQPSLILWNDAGPREYRNTEALAAFRDALALSVVPGKIASILDRDSQEKLTYTNWFNIYPWMTGSDDKYVVMRNSVGTGVHETIQLKPQIAPSLNQEIIQKRDIDATLHKELMVRFKRRFANATPSWDDTKLFRSLNMANAAGQLPSQGDFTPYDAGRAIALWASAFEIAAHPGSGKPGHLQVYGLLEKVEWQTIACKDARHPCMAPPEARRPRVLACAIYSRIHSARSDYLHGNKVSDVQLAVMPYKRFLPDYAPVLYRAALSGLLSLKFDEPQPAETNAAEYEAWFSRDHSHRRFNREMESALGTFLLTQEQQRRKRLGLPIDPVVEVKRGDEAGSRAPEVGHRAKK
jgi:hypothetical protein